MANGNPLKRKLRAGQACFGAWMLSTSADMAEVLGYAGVDVLLLDHEHGQGSIDDAIGQLRAIKGSDCVGILRVPSNDPVYIKRALDAGVGGIMVPNVNSAKEARRVVDACRCGKVAKEMAARGYRFIIPGSDVTLLGLGVRTTLADAKG